MEPITTTKELAAVCTRLAKHDFVTVDTEFLRETTYFPILCVAQVASADEAVVIDALAEGIDLAPFFKLMANEKVLKVFHAARQDIEIVWHRAKIIPHPVFDTQVAAMVLGYGDFDLLRPARAAHHRRHARQVEPFHRLDAPAADRRRSSNTRSPTSPTCATLSRALRRHRQARPHRLGRRGDEDPHLAGHLSHGAGNAWLRLKTRARKPKELAVLMEVAAWREREAQARDVPRGRVLKDEVIGDLAVQAPTTVEKLAGLRSLPEGLRALEMGHDILEAVKRGLARDPKSLPMLERSRQAAERHGDVELLKVLLRMTAERNGVAAKVIATVDDLEQIAASDEADVPALKGWRREMFGEKAIALKHGRLALAVERHRVVAVERNQLRHQKRFVACGFLG